MELHSIPQRMSSILVKPPDVVHGFIFGTLKKVLQNVCQSKGNEKREK